MRYFFEISYRGTDFHGWQKQNNAITVQEVVEKALKTLYRLDIPITGSGRTDTGVHCRQQYFHAELPAILNSKEDLLYRLNSLLPYSVAIQNIYEVPENAHTRFDALNRYYEYYISTKKDPLMHGLSYPYFKKLDVETMSKAAALLVGEHDFESFSKVKTDVNTFNCRIFEASWKKEKHVLIFCIRGNRFLRGMVRAIVGTLLEVGQKKITPDDFQEIIDKKNRKFAGTAAPPEGLYLTEVIYPEGYLKN